MDTIVEEILVETERGGGTYVTPTCSAQDLINAGAELHRNKQLQGAYLNYLAALSLDRDNWLAWQNISAVLIAMERYVVAEHAARNAMSLAPEGVEPAYIMANLGSALIGLRRYTDAVDVLLRAVQRVPGDGIVWHKLGMAYYASGNFSSALSAFTTAHDLVPENPSITADRAHAMLALGEIRSGMLEFGVRWKNLFKCKAWGLNLPLWHGEDVCFKRILVTHEQGFGDAIMMCRYVSTLWEKGANVTVAVPRELARLLSFSFRHPGGIEVVDWNDELSAENYDFHCPMLDLLLGFNVIGPEDILAPGAYLAASEPYKFPEVIRPAFKVGLCWTSGEHGRALKRRQRITSLTDFAPLLALPKTVVVSLQKGNAAKDIETSGAMGLIYDPMAGVEDFADTANVIASLDVVLTVDSAVAHLAGAMGKPTVVLRPSTALLALVGRSLGRALV